MSFVTGPARIEVNPPADTLNAVGDTLRLTATVYDSADAVLPNPVTWVTSDAARATVDNTGLVTATGRGKVNISARIGTLRGTSKLLVQQVVETISVTPTPHTIEVGDTFRLTAAATDSNASPVLGGRTTWRSGNDAIATVDSTGLVTALTAGVINISARVSGTNIISAAIGRARITTQYTPGSFQISPAADTIRTIGRTVQLSTPDIVIGGVTQQVEWKSLNPGIVSVHATSGLATAVGRGAARIVAKAGTYTDTAEIRVTLTTASVNVTPDSLFMAPGNTENAVGQQVDSSGFQFGSLEWSSRDTTIATVSAAGLVTAVAPGTVSIIGTRLGFSDSVVVVVGSADSTTHEWTTGVAGDWTDATKWTPAVAPAETDTAKVLVSGSDVSLTAATTIAHLTMGTNTSIELASFDFTVVYDVLAGDGVISASTGGTLRLTGAGGISGTLPRTIITGARSLAGSTTVTNSLTISDGSLVISDQALVISIP